MDKAEQTTVATILQELWVEEQKALGYHLPSKCPNYEDNRDDDESMADLIHCKQCNSLLLPYHELDGYSRGKLDEKAAKLLSSLQKNGYTLKKG